MTTQNALDLDHWIRTSFKQINTALELLYIEQENPDTVADIGVNLKQQLVDEGGAHLAHLLAEGNTDEGFDNGFDLLGNVGLFMAACRRHEIGDAIEDDLSESLRVASALSMQLGASLGVVPRFASAHLETHNAAIDGVYKSFTSLEDEVRFIDHNTRGVFAYIRASQALLNARPLGVSHPIVYDLLMAAKAALDDVVSNNSQLFDKLDVDRFFYNVRPYYKTHKVGLREYRGANAGDFAGINVIDLLLGVCRASDAYYSQLLVDKFLFMRPEDQLILRDCMRRTSLMDSFLDSLDCEQHEEPWYRKNLDMFLKVCAAHGEAAQQHHDQLIEKFISRPADDADWTNKPDLTASGPPLPVMLKGLKKLCDLRSASDVIDTDTRFADVRRLTASLS